MNLPRPMVAEPVAGGIRVTGTTAGVLRLARYVVGLGAAARAETPELALLVVDGEYSELERHRTPEARSTAPSSPRRPP